MTGGEGVDQDALGAWRQQLAAEHVGMGQTDDHMMLGVPPDQDAAGIVVETVFDVRTELAVRTKADAASEAVAVDTAEQRKNHAPERHSHMLGISSRA